MSYIGSTPTTQSFISGTDYFNGDGSTTAFTLTRTVASVNDIEAVVNNVVQQPNSAYNISGTTITFTSAPSSGTGNVYVRYMSTTTQSITPSQNTVSYATWDNDLRNETFAFKNRIINGAMMIDQRNAGASVTPSTGTYTLDRWRAYSNNGTAFTVQQSSTAPAGFVNSMLITSTASTSVGASDYYFFQQSIEGFNSADLGWGTANASTVTLSFWVRSSLTGTFGGAISNRSSSDRSYPFNYTISAANTWEQKSITIVGDTTGTWLTNNGIGLKLIFDLGSGSNNIGTAGAWSAADRYGATGDTKVVGTNGATFYITGVMLEKGSTATNYDVRPYGTELALCQRYYYQMVSPSASEKYFGSGFYYASTLFAATYSFPVTMRTAPTLSYVTGTGFYTIYTSGTQDAINAFSAVRTHPNGGGLDSDGLSTSGIQGAGGAISTNNAAAAVGFSAEL